MTHWTGLVFSALPAVATDRHVDGKVLAGRDDQQHRDATTGLPVGFVDQCELLPMVRSSRKVSDGIPTPNRSSRILSNFTTKSWRNS